MKAPIDPAALHALIGRQFSWKGERYTAIEILSQPLALVAQNLLADPHIQTDVHGRAHRVIQTDIISIPVLNHDGTQLHPEFLLISAWLLPDPKS